MKKKIMQDLGPSYWLVDPDGAGPEIELSEEDWREWQETNEKYGAWQDRLHKTWKASS